MLVESATSLGFGSGSPSLLKRATITGDVVLAASFPRHSHESLAGSLRPNFSVNSLISSASTFPEKIFLVADFLLAQPYLHLADIIIH
jgi:hypothetical protein